MVFESPGLSGPVCRGPVPPRDESDPLPKPTRNDLRCPGHDTQLEYDPGDRANPERWTPRNEDGRRTQSQLTTTARRTSGTWTSWWMNWPRADRWRRSCAGRMAVRIAADYFDGREQDQAHQG